MGDPLEETRETKGRGIGDTAAGDKVVRGVLMGAPGRGTPVIRRRDYVDNIFTTLRWVQILHTYILEYDIGGKTRWVEVGADRLGWTEAMQHPSEYLGWSTRTKLVSPFEYEEDFGHAYARAMKAKLKATATDESQEDTAFVSFYKVPEERGSVIVPTRYTRTSAPRLFSSLLQLHGDRPIPEARKNAYVEWGEGFRVGANVVVLNRIGLQMNEKGEYEPAFEPLERAPKMKMPKAAKQGGESRPERGSNTAKEKKSVKPPAPTALEKLGPLHKMVMSIVGDDKKARAAAERMAERGHTGLLKNIAEEYGSIPKEGAKLLTEIGKLKDVQIDGLEAIRRALGDGRLTRTYKGGKLELDWLDFFKNFKIPEKERNTVLALVGEIHGVVDPASLAKSVGMMLRANPSDIAGGLGVFHAAAGLKQKYAKQNPRIRLEERTVTPSTRGDMAREVDVVVVIGNREIHHEVKTYDKVFISEGFEWQIAKDLLRHHADNFENQQYLFSPKLKSKLNPVREKIMEIFDKKTAPELQRQNMKTNDIADRRKRLEKRLKDDMVDSFSWFPAP